MTYINEDGERIAWQDKAMEKAAVVRRENLSRIILDKLLAPKRGQQNACYAGAIAIALTCSGRPTGVLEVEKHWHRKSQQMPTLKDMLLANRWVMSQGRKLHVFYPKGYVPFEPYYRPDSKLTMEDFLREYGRIWGKAEQEACRRIFGDEAQFADIMETVRETDRRYPRGTKHTIVSAITPKLLSEALKAGPALARQETDDGPHEVALIDAHTHPDSKISSQLCFSFFDPSPVSCKYDREDGNTSPWCLPDVKYLDSKGSLIVIKS